MGPPVAPRHRPRLTRSEIRRYKPAPTEIPRPPSASANRDPARRPPLTRYFTPASRFHCACAITTSGESCSAR